MGRNRKRQKAKAKAQSGDSAAIEEKTAGSNAAAGGAGGGAGAGAGAGAAGDAAAAKLVIDSSVTAAQLKERGNAAFVGKQYSVAVAYYTEAIRRDDSDKSFYSNRAAALSAMNNPQGFLQALEDGRKCVELDAAWSRGYFRVGTALKGLGRFAEAKVALEKALELQPGHAPTQALLEEVKNAELPDHIADPGGDGGDSDKFDALITWLQTPVGAGGREAQVSEFPLLYMKRYSENNRGVHCRVDIGAGVQILSVPRRYLITVEMGQELEIGKQMIAADVDVTAKKHCYLCVYALVDRLNMDSYFQPYYNILPTEYPNMPIFWDESQLEWLEGSYLLKQIEDRKHNIATDHDTIARAAPDFGRFTVHDFSWARMMVASRNFGITIDKSKTDALVPFADMLNHFRPRETKWTFDQDTYCFTISTLKKLKAGHQVYDSYGKKCNSRFLLNYGFAVEKNQEANDGQNHNEVRLLFSLVDRKLDPWANHRLGLLGDGKATRGVRLGTWYPHKSTLEVFSFLRFAFAKGNEILMLPSLKSNHDYLNHPIKPISPANEIMVLRTIASLCETQLARYPTTLEEDQKTLDDGVYELYSNHRNAIVVLRGEKEVCHYYIELAKVCVPLLQMQWKDVKKLINNRYKTPLNRKKYLDLCISGLIKKAASTGGASGTAMTEAKIAATQPLGTLPGVAGTGGAGSKK